MVAKNSMIHKLIFIEQLEDNLNHELNIVQEMSLNHGYKVNIGM